MKQAPVPDLLAMRGVLIRDITALGTRWEYIDKESRIVQILRRSSVDHPGTVLPSIQLCRSVPDGRRMLVRPRPNRAEITYLFSGTEATRIHRYVWKFSHPLSAMEDIYRRLAKTFRILTQELECDSEFYAKTASVYRECAALLSPWKRAPLRLRSLRR